jgi:hypothetical protein
MKNYLIAFMVSLATIILLRIISGLLNFEISDFMMGWLSCTGFYMTFNELNANEKSEE